jgi:hypothetical protein
MRYSLAGMRLLRSRHFRDSLLQQFAHEDSGQCCRQGGRQYGFHVFKRALRPGGPMQAPAALPRERRPI